MSDWGEDRLEHQARKQLKPYSHALPTPCNEPFVVGLFEGFLEGRQLPIELARASGWYPTINGGDSLPRVVIPCYSRVDTNKFWQARALMDREPRYQSPHGVRRGDAIALLWPFQRDYQGVLVCEGPMDALAAAELGWVSMATLGTKPTEEALSTVAFFRNFYAPLPLIILGDRDPSGEEWMLNLSRRFLGAQLVVPPPPYKDLAEMPHKERGPFLKGD